MTRVPSSLVRFGPPIEIRAPWKHGKLCQNGAFLVPKPTWSTSKLKVNGRNSTKPNSYWSRTISQVGMIGSRPLYLGQFPLVWLGLFSWLLHVITWRIIPLSKWSTTLVRWLVCCPSLLSLFLGGWNNGLWVWSLTMYDLRDDPPSATCGSDSWGAAAPEESTPLASALSPRLRRLCALATTAPSTSISAWMALTSNLLCCRHGGWRTCDVILVGSSVRIKVSNYFELTLIVSSAGLLDPPFHRSVGLKAIECGPASEIYPDWIFLKIPGLADGG